MTFDEVLEQVRELLQSKGRVAYRALKRRFELDDEYLEDLKAELIDAEQVARDEDGKVLVWKGGTDEAETENRRNGETETISPQSAVRSPESERILVKRATAEGERRQLTVMFCDLVGSTALSEQLDPEELRDIVRAYQQTSAAVIERFDGHIAQYLGDGLLVYFGHPTAHEDDAARAVRAGLGIVEAVQELNTRLSHPIQVRVGIHTGPVVVGEMGGGSRREQLALGETPNLAARIQGIAAPDEVVISAATYRLVEGLFECEDRGQPALKGVSASLTLYRVLKEGEAKNRFQVVARKGLMPLVGREHELGLLQERWEQATTGAGQVVLLSGEPGIGKSRLAQQLKDHVAQDGAVRIEFRCSPYHQNSAFYPIIEHVQRFLQFTREDTPQTKLTKLQQALAQHRFPQADTLLLLATLLSLPHPEGMPALALSPQKQKQKTQEALVAWIVEEAEKAAVCCVWEDLHWADPSTLEVLSLYLDQAPATRQLALLTFRPDFTPPWRPRAHITQLTLNRLGRPQVEAMVAQVTGGKALPAEVVQQIITKTDGVPLFVEELTKMVLESGLLREEDGRYVGAHGGAPIPPLAIPATLQDSLMARLDRLSTVREIAQVGATLGREFSYDLLHAVSPVDEAALQQGLRRLVEAELVYQRGLPPQATYLFKHALVQDAAYQSLLKSKRQQYHQQIAQVLEERLSETKETQPELVAHHYTEARLTEQAIPYWQQAGERATQRSAYVEAISHLTKGLELLKTLPDTPERAQQELTLQLALGTALFAVKGYTTSDVEKTYSRARELCQQVGETPQLFPVLWSLVVFYNNRGEGQTARELAEQAMRLAQSVQDPHLLSAAHGSLGWTLSLLGELTSARTLLEQGIALYDPQKHPGRDDPRVVCLSYAAWTLWTLGYPDQALKRSHEALALAAGLSHPLLLAHTLALAALFHLFRREEQVARERAEAVITLSTEQGFPFWLTYGTIMWGGALAEQGQVEEGIAQMQQGLAARQAMGAEGRLPYFLALLAEAYGRVGQVEKGLTALVEALAMGNKNGERWWEAELYRLKGELSLQSRSPQSAVSSPKPPISNPQAEAEAEACFHKAIEIARRQSAKSLELRAVMSLSRLWQKQDKKDEARQMLAEVYGWFTEGFETKDLQEVKGLLDSLGSSV